VFDRGRAGLGDIMQLTANMHLATGRCHLLRRALQPTATICVSTHLQGASDAGQDVD
jgi:hypothetical protein